jgi:hypothetical protein
MLGTFLVAITLGIARLASAGEQRMEPRTWILLGAGLAALSAFSVLPLGMFALRGLIRIPL